MRTPSTPGAPGPAELPPSDAGARRQRLQRQRLQSPLGRVDAALRQWEAWEANQRRPPTDRASLPRPAIARSSRAALRALLLEELAHLDAAGAQERHPCAGSSAGSSEVGDRALYKR